MQGIHLRKYGVEAVIPFVLYETDGIDLKVDAVDGGTDCTITKDEGAEATCTNDFVDEGTGYSITLTATEMQAARITVYVVDAATKVYLDDAIIIETYGHASAQHAMDLDDAVRGGMTALPNAAADAVGGLPISDAGGLDMDSILTYSVSSAAWGSINSGILFRGTVTADVPGVSFTIAGLAGQGAGAFVDANTPWYAYVFRDGGGAAAAPQGEIQKVTGYTTATGLFTTDAFTAPVATGDDIMIVSAALTNSLYTRGIVDTIVADTNELQTDWANGGRLDLLIDQLIAACITNATGADIATDIAGILGTDGQVLISTDAQDLSATLDVNTKTITNGIIVAATLGADCITNAKIADDAIAAENLATGAIAADAVAATALNNIAMSDLAAVPAATASIVAAINWMFEVCRNRMLTDKTDGEIRLYRDDAATVFAESDISDDTDHFDRGEFGAVD